MLKIEDLSLQRGGQWLLEHSMATIQPGQRVAMVGANGVGKSSLFALILGQLTPDSGSISLPGGCRLAHMAQEVAGSDRSALDFVLDGHKELRDLEQALAAAEAAQDDQALARIHGDLDTLEAWAAPRQGEQLLRGLGFVDADMTRPVSDFSGGWRIRLNLAQALMMPSEVMLLDEPTNHLDIEACYWLERRLRQYSGTLLFISHDRDFMDRVATHVMHFEQHQLFTYTGNYYSFEKQRAEKLALQQAQHEKQQKRVAEIQGFVDRFRAQATKAKQAQSRIKALERMQLVAPVHAASKFQFRFPAAEKVSSPLLSVRDGAVGYGDKPLLSGINLSLMPGSRIGLLGANGAGKSTLIGALRGSRSLLKGERTTGEHFHAGYFAQHQLDELDLNASGFTHLLRLTPGASEQAIRNFLGGFGFKGDDATVGIRHFSGGEKARLALAILAWQKPNVLFLDEPTNHLDLDMRQALAFALQDFSGAMILVSHDRHLLRNTVDTFWRVAGGSVSEFDGDLDEYERWLSEGAVLEGASGSDEAGPGNGSTTAAADSGEDRKARKRLEAEQRKKLSPFRKQAAQFEAQLEKLQQELAVVEERMADTTLYEAHRKDDLQKLLSQQGSLQSQLEKTEEDWLAISEEIESLEATLS
ncbi:MAG: ATP-binding cassette domain-containing protein [Halomonadaceae bacterium]|nr:MAG: ATP-binding cassette domain-containing protein [Halomonadaceae bacterium]